MMQNEKDFNQIDDRIRDIFHNHGFEDIPHTTRHQFTRFYIELMEEQKHHNSTRLRTLREVVIKHFVDSLMVLKVAKLEFPLLDVGTGPGFPGIPLKIMLPEPQILLAEGVQKRVEFLKRMRETLNLKKLDIIGRQVNEDFHYPVQAVITRAFAETPDTLRQVMNCLKTGGKVFLMKGPNVDAELKTAEREWGEYFRLIENKPYELPHTPHQRRMVIYQKMAHKELEYHEKDVD
ncbi:MAG: 16S rRNA (guanine(527)-N(7))-methyltransferase RsmG [Bdellovibrionales bacterium]